jgi:hypothetical protein
MCLVSSGGLLGQVESPVLGGRREKRKEKEIGL